ncbi:nuclear transport factor 2 family protein [Yinghuangia sp. YIM S09857]|uniref:nuclear transport factor 2 family protein n=1 Tax=Yinghuangia sp. YIM S09857 TaxID=3436929 RepID=UPI003F535BEE
MDPTMQFLADRTALRDLVQDYAGNADRRLPHAVAACFVPDGHLVLERGPGQAEVLAGRAAIAGALADLDRYRTTTHFVGNHTARIDGDTAEGETYCLAHHIYEQDGADRDTLMSIRYRDAYERTGQGWRIRTRTLTFDWIADRPLRDA